MSTASSKEKRVARWGTRSVLRQGPIAYQRVQWRRAASRSSGFGQASAKQQDVHCADRACGENCAAPTVWKCTKGASPPGPLLYPPLSLLCTPCPITRICPYRPYWPSKRSPWACPFAFIPDPDGENMSGTHLCTKTCTMASKLMPLKRCKAEFPD